MRSREQRLYISLNSRIAVRRDRSRSGVCATRSPWVRMRFAESVVRLLPLLPTKSSILYRTERIKPTTSSKNALDVATRGNHEALPTITASGGLSEFRSSGAGTVPNGYGEGPGAG